jgi:general stress protein YciG
MSDTIPAPRRPQGFAAMSRERNREISRKGGLEAQRRGTANRWTAETAREAGRKGGLALQAKKRAAQEPDETETAT